jgi:integrase
MAKRLTDISVQRAKPRENRVGQAIRTEIPDAGKPGLFLIVQPTGRKSWAVRYRRPSDNKPRKLTLKGFPSLGEAHKLAQAALDEVATGGDPAGEVKAGRDEAKTGKFLVENVFEKFLEKHAKHKRSGGEMERAFRKDVLPLWQGKDIRSITTRDINDVLDALEGRGLTVAVNRRLGLMKKFFSWAASGRQLYITASPAAGIERPFEEKSRERTLSDDEIRRIWISCVRLGYPFGPLFQLLLVTGQRRTEVSGMAWDEIDLNNRLWMLPGGRAKNARDHSVPLSDLAIGIIESLPRIAGENQLLFTTTGETPVSGYSRAKNNLDTAIVMDGDGSIAPWVLHDIRRTVATGMQRLAIPPHITEAVLNHKSGTIRGVAAVYSRYDYADEKHAALDTWAKFLSAIIDGRADAFLGKKADNVVPFAAAEA